MFSNIFTQHKKDLYKPRMCSYEVDFISDAFKFGIVDIGAVKCHNLIYWQHIDRDSPFQRTSLTVWRLHPTACCVGACLHDAACGPLLS